MLDITVIILTYNEELHIERCLNNAKRFARDIYVVDSFSTDRTVEIAAHLGGAVYQHEWTNYSRQFNWALMTLPIRTEWVWRMDADEYLSDELISELHVRLPESPAGVNGYSALRRIVFMGRLMRHGSLPLVMVRLFRYRYGRIEDRMMDEHIVITEGEIGELEEPFYDDNLNGLTWWTEKHNGYATREAADLLLTEYGMMRDTPVVNSGAHSRAVRQKKLRYAKMPLFWRAFGFFVYRYILRLGFLDGREGFLWHFLQGFWYRVLADAKVYEIRKRFGGDGERIRAFLAESYAEKQTGGQ